MFCRKVRQKKKIRENNNKDNARDPSADGRRNVPRRIVGGRKRNDLDRSSDGAGYLIFRVLISNFHQESLAKTEEKGKKGIVNSEW